MQCVFLQTAVCCISLSLLTVLSARPTEDRLTRLETLRSSDVLVGQRHRPREPLLSPDHRDPLLLLSPDHRHRDPLLVPERPPASSSPNVVLSTHRRLPGSPGHKAGSPGHKAGSPGHKAGYPGHKAGSPGHKAGSPGHKAGSPGHKAGSPGHKAGSPGHKAGSPGHKAPTDSSPPSLAWARPGKGTAPWRIRRHAPSRSRGSPGGSRGAGGRSHPHHPPQLMRVGCVLGTCQVQNLSHRLYQLIGQSGREDHSPINPRSPHSYG